VKFQSIATILVFVSRVAFAAGTAAPNAEPPKNVPQSVWQINPGGDALHLQSQWKCAAAYGDYRRDQLYVFDTYGLDVDCNYRHVNQRDDITVYLTKKTGGDIKAAFNEGMQALVKRTADAVPLPDSQQITFASDRPWLHRIYAIYGGKAHDGIWYAWLGDWQIEIRATYPANEDAGTMAVLKQMVEDAERTAGGHLERCAKSPVPERSGILVTDPAGQQAAVLMSIAMSGNIAVEDQRTNSTNLLPRSGPPEWCAEAAAGSTTEPILMWHAVDSEGRSLPLDRVSLMSMGPAPFLDSAEPLGTAIPGMEIAEPTFVVSHPSGDEVFVYAVFKNRPNAKSLAAILTDYVRDKARVLAKGNPKTNNVTVFTDPKK
jgi:hypothetical protein